MYQKAQSIYYGLAMFVLGAALFAMQPSATPQVAALQKDIASQFDVAWQQTIGDGPWFEDLSLIYDSIAAFYDQSADITIALLEDAEADEDVIYVFGQVYRAFAQAFDPDFANPNTAYEEFALPAVSSHFMTQEPLYNIDNTTLTASHTGDVAGVSITQNQPVNSDAMPWVTIKDNATGQLYCLAVYNGTVNQYLGACRYDGYY